MEFDNAMIEGYLQEHFEQFKELERREVLNAALVEALKGLSEDDLIELYNALEEFDPIHRREEFDEVMEDKTPLEVAESVAYGFTFVKCLPVDGVCADPAAPFFVIDDTGLVNSFASVLDFRAVDVLVEDFISSYRCEALEYICDYFDIPDEKRC